MDREEAFSLFGALIERANRECFEVTRSSVSTETKPDRTLVSNCDVAIDNVLSDMATNLGLKVVSEEGQASLDIVATGNYLTIDPIDGTLGYLDYVQDAIDRGGIDRFGDIDLGPKSDFSLLLSVVENGVPTFGACANYITREQIFIDSSSPQALVWTNRRRFHTGSIVAYVDPRPGDDIEKEIRAVDQVSIIVQATLGLKSLYAILGEHEHAVVCHRVQSAGLWDVAPVAVAIRAFGGELLDDQGSPVCFERYVTLPGRGATVLKGRRFDFVRERLR